MSKFSQLYEEFTDKFKTALRNNFNSDDIRYECPKCKFIIPKYQGKYPGKCPQCNKSVDMKKYRLKHNLEKCGLQYDMEPFDDKLQSTDNDRNASVTNAMLKGFSNHMNGDKVYKKCSNCGFNIPKYKGRYPKLCPSCKT